MPELSHSTIATRLAVRFATVCGIGWLRPGPGTWASIAAGLAALAVLYIVPIAYVTMTLVGLALAATLLSLWILPRAVVQFGHGDPSQVVIDEVAGTWVAIALIPAHILQADMLIGVLVAVLLFRVFDIAKPWPVSWFERLPGALGIMADDLVAGAVAGCLTAALLH